MAREFAGKPHEVVQWLMNQDRDATFEVRERKPRRSLTQNAYYWALNAKLADKLRMPRDEVHFLMLKRYAPCEVFTVLKKVPLQDYFKYAEVFRDGVLNGKEYNHVKIYKGSSHMDSAEFSRLLEGVRDECEAQGIPTMTPREIAELEFVGPKGD